MKCEYVFFLIGLLLLMLLAEDIAPQSSELQHRILKRSKGMQYSIGNQGYRKDRPFRETRRDHTRGHRGGYEYRSGCGLRGGMKGWCNTRYRQGFGDLFPIIF